jgi:TolB-like protein
VVRLNHDVPPKLEDTINKALEKDRNLRYQSAAEMRADLQRLKRDTDSGKAAAVTELAPVSRSRRLQWVVAGVFIAAIVIAIVLWQFRQPQALRSDSASSKAIAVLPFQNAGSDKDTDFLRLALPDEIANTLSYVQSFSIRPFATTSKYSGPNLDLQQAGREMGVNSIVTGHYLTEGNQLEVTLEAVDVANNRSVWRDTVAVVASDKIAMREQITTRVRQGLVPALGGSSASGEAATLYMSFVNVCQRIRIPLSPPVFQWLTLRTCRCHGLRPGQENKNMDQQRGQKGSFEGAPKDRNPNQPDQSQNRKHA